MAFNNKNSIKHIEEAFNIERESYKRTINGLTKLVESQPAADVDSLMSRINQLEDDLREAHNINDDRVKTIASLRSQLDELSNRYTELSKKKTSTMDERMRKEYKRMKQAEYNRRYLAKKKAAQSE